MGKKQISVTLDEEVIEEIDKLAEGMGIGRSTMINTLLRTGFMGDYKSMVKVASKASRAKKANKLISESILT